MTFADEFLLVLKKENENVSVFGVEPDLTREGGSIPVTLTLQETTGKNTMLLPVGACDDGAHSQNEKIDRRNYIEGVGQDFSLRIELEIKK